MHLNTDTQIITLEVNNEFIDLCDEARSFSGDLSAEDTLKKALEDYIKNHSPKPKKISKSERTKIEYFEKVSKLVPKIVRRKTREHDKNRCTYVSLDGKRCSEIFYTRSERPLDNLRVLCNTHNQLFVEKIFGKIKTLAITKVS